MQRHQLFASLISSALIFIASPTSTEAAAVAGTLVIDAQGLDVYCEFGSLGVPSRIPVNVKGKTAIPKILKSGKETFKVASGTYVISPRTFNCNAKTYSPVLSSVSVKVAGRATTTAKIKYQVIAEVLYGRTWNDGDWWRIPLGFKPKSVDFDEVQFRIVGEQGKWSSVYPTKWLVQYDSGDPQLKVIDTPDVDMEFRLVKHGYKNGFNQVIRAWYSPYTCGYNSCSYPKYNLLDSPLN